MCKKLFQILFLGLLGASTLAEARLPPIKPGVPGKNKGDIIAPMLDEQVAAWCDFNKQIIMTRSNILCAYIGHNSETQTARLEKRAAPKKLAKSRPVPKELAPTPYEMNEYGDDA